MCDNIYYIKTLETIEEIINDEDETTYKIAGEISDNGKPFKKCIFYWRDDRKK